MDPNQQPGQPQPPTPESQLPPTLQPSVDSQPAYPPQQDPTLTPVQPVTPQTPSTYSNTSAPNYDPNYLDSIAPPPPAPKFFSGSFGKIFFGLLGLLFVAVSIMVAFSGKDPSADLQQVAVRLENFSKTAKTVQKSLASNNLSDTNTEFQIWLTGNQATAEKMLKDGGINKAKYSKTMVASEAKITANLDAKFENERLNARLDRSYANTMAAETTKIINLLNSITKKNKSGKVHDFAQNASKNLVAIQMAFESYNDDGN
jgi:predicted lipid-binding transport protein (Tim44 family)